MPPQAGAPAAQPGAEDPYAQYGGYQNYVMLWMAAASQMGGQGQAPGGPPGA